jgi:sugar phosphate isomerase/epimerase
MADQQQSALGAALFIKSISAHKEWLCEGSHDLEIQDPVMPAVLDGNWKMLVRQAHAELDGFGGRIGIHGPFLGFSLIAGFDPMIADAVITRLRMALEFAGEIGAEYMVIHSPFIGFGASPFSISALPRDLFNERIFIQTIVHGILEQAKAVQCKLVIENVQDNNTAPLCDLVRSFDSEYVSMSLDVGHAFITHQHGGPTPDQWVRDAGPILAHMHLQDSDGQTDRHWAPGDGAVNWFALFEELSTLERMPRLILELRDHRNIERAAQYLANRGFTT